MPRARLLSPPHWVLGFCLTGVVGLFWVLRVLQSGSEKSLSVTDLFLYYLPSYDMSSCYDRVHSSGLLG